MKKILCIIPLVSSLFFASFAYAQTSTIVLPSNFNNNLLAQTNMLLGSFAPYIELIVGVLLALVAIEFILSAMHK